jgi:hypothetical protein
MADRDVIDIGPGGRVTELIWDGDKVHVGCRQDVTTLLDDNVRRQNNGPGWLSKAREMRHVARLNMETVVELMKSGIWHDRKRFRRWLNDPDHRKLRTDTCRL